MCRLFGKCLLHHIYITLNSFVNFRREYVYLYTNILLSKSTEEGRFNLHIFTFLWVLTNHFSISCSNSIEFISHRKKYFWKVYFVFLSKDMIKLHNSHRVASATDGHLVYRHIRRTWTPEQALESELQWCRGAAVLPIRINNTVKPVCNDHL